MLKRIKGWFANRAEIRRINREAKLIHSGLIASGQAVRTRARDHRTLATVTDDEVIVDYMDGRYIGQRGVEPRIVRPFGMWRWKH